MDASTVGMRRGASAVHALFHRLSAGTALPPAWFAFVGVCCCLPLISGSILQTLGPDDLANHVRHTYEYGLALKQHQLPPLVAPTLNGNERIPLFQYYSGTGYLIPGTLSALGIDAYAALKLAIALSLAVGGFFSYLACRRLGLRTAPAIVAGTAFELFPFVGTDLFVRGAYPEILACTTMPLLLYLVLRLVQTRERSPLLRLLCATGAAWAFFLAVHPIQAILGSVLVIALGTVYALSRTDQPLRRRWRGLAVIAAAAGLAVVGSLWFWYPIARDYGAIRVADYGQFGDAGLNHLAVLLWPGYRSSDSVAAGWSPQLGLHFAVAALLAVAWFRRTGALAAVSGLILCAIVVLIRWHAAIPFADKLFEPLQWTYRLLIPAALVGMLCVGFVLNAIERRFPDRRAGLVVGLCAGYVLALGIPYFANRGTVYSAFGSAHVVGPAYRSVNADFYGLRGSDFRRLGLVRDRTLTTATDIGLLAEGYPFHVRLVLSPPTPDARLAVLVNGQPAPDATTRRGANGASRIVEFSLHPPIGNEPGGSRVLRLDPSTPGEKWRVIDYTFHPDGDPAGRGVRIPASVVPVGDVPTAWHVDVPRGRAGLYQLPILHLPSGVQSVDGREVEQESSDRFMTILPLHAGRNLVRFETRPSLFGLAGLALLLLAVASAVATWLGVRVPARRT